MNTLLIAILGFLKFKIIFTLVKIAILFAIFLAVIALAAFVIRKLASKA
ncbi:MAG: hypothetical protein HY819_20200 [Acidobacteria bacterium]|nr:hypothetical protein [Acidobacteriota bacterium]